jgi:predicted RNA-binding protein
MPGEESFPYRVKLKPVEIFDEPLFQVIDTKA